MKTKWKIGDLALCVDDSDFTGMNSNKEIRKGNIYTIIEVLSEGENYWLTIKPFGVGWNHKRFTKCDREEKLRRILKCK